MNDNVSNRNVSSSNVSDGNVSSSNVSDGNVSSSNVSDSNVSNGSGFTDLVLTKHHGLGNDFLIGVEPARPINDDEVRLLCDRRLGLGADGLITADAPDRNGRRRMVLRNADGSRAEISGNGIRCLGQAIAGHDRLDPTVTHRLEIETDAGLRVLDLGSVTSGSRTVTVTVGMGTVGDGPGPSESWPAAGVAIKEQMSADLGNPHLVGFVDDLAAHRIGAVGPVIEADYPDGCNIHLARVVDPSTVEVAVWERGVGVTQACGSGACAVAWTANRLGYVDSKVTVRMPGGSVVVKLTEDGVQLTGPSTFVAEVRV